ncbi:envelope stress response membrane protein PspC [Algibacillus agarilyticus]|uniref:envelope stress response membrane protein PspC n=1 Tax=Algibacillus agarilyticus TaxID=2234133 RepID=UPI000DD066D7|nr:envelope stress response membrane protein PspC [Algibacillus agarilyticus]
MTNGKKFEIKRNTDNGKIAGVCAGIADYYGWETWLVRIIAVSGLFLSGSFFFFAYIALWIILDKKPSGRNWRSNLTRDDNIHFEIKSKVWQAGEPPKRAFHEIKATFDHLEVKLQKIERYVTSKQYSVNREINRL